VAASAAFLSVLVLAGAPASGITRHLQRIAGADRYQTAVDLSVATFPEGAGHAVIASGAAFPDGLAAGPLAALRDGPVLLTTPDGLPPQVATELQRLAVAEITVVGGPAAVQDVVLESITAATGITPTRVFGPDRYTTAALVSQAFPGATPVYVASGVTFPDALAGGAAAAAAGAPLVLTPPDALPEAVVTELTRLAPTEIRILGGGAAVGTAVEERLRTLSPSVLRIAGADRYATAATLATFGGARPTEALVTTGRTFPDALASAGLAASRGAPILLTDTRCAPNVTVDTLRNLGWPDLTAIGGTASVTPAAAGIVPCTGIPDGLLAPGVTLTTQVLPGPRVVHILTLDRRQGYDVRTTTATGNLEGRLHTSEIARRWNALAVVNGAFFRPDGSPSHAFAMGGRLLRWPGQVNTLVGFDPAKTTYGFFGRPQATVELQLGADPTGIPLDLVNAGAPAGEQTALLTPDSRAELPAGEWCRVLLTSTGAPTVGDDAVTRQPYSTGSGSCSSEPVPRSADVLVAPPGTVAGERIDDLTAGKPLFVRWRAHTTDQGVLDLIGANATLVFGGRVADEVLQGGGTFYSLRAGRTAIAQRGNGDLLLVVVDGRQEGYSIGMTPRELADHLVTLGAHDAANLDGGGSSAMAVHGVLVNRPSDPGGERSVGSALVVVPRGTPVPAPVAGVGEPLIDPDEDAAAA
jgi:putative cell wall-binding protein